jgi:hypothetical protein
MEVSITTDIVYQNPFAKPELFHAYELWCRKEVPVDYLIKHGRNYVTTLESGSLKKGLNESTTYGRALFLRPDVRDPLFLREWNKIVLPKVGFDHWHDPLAVTYVADRLGSLYKTPLCTEEIKGRKEIFELKKKVYGEVPADWLLLIASLKPADQAMVSLCRNLWAEPEGPGSKYQFESLIRLLRKYPGVGRSLSATDKSVDEVKEALLNTIYARESRAIFKRTLAERRILKVLDDSFNSPRDLTDDYDVYHPLKMMEKTGNLTVQKRALLEEKIMDKFFDSTILRTPEDDMPKVFDIAIDDEPIEIGDDSISVEETHMVVWDDCAPDDFDFG